MMNSKPLKIGLFGGSFDPLHNGHLQLADAAQKAFDLHRVIFVPALQPPHKQHQHLTSIRHRLNMLILALKPFPCFSISHFELKRKTTTYTFQTVRYFRKRYPDAQLYFILGTDSLNDFTTWKRTDELVRQCTLIAGRRGRTAPGRSLSRWPVQFVPETIAPISSSEVRQRIHDGKPVHNLIPSAVERYIAQHHLYASS